MHKLVTDERIVLLAESGSVCELDRSDWLADEFCVEPPIFWFTRIKAKKEGCGDGSFLMAILVEILDNSGFSVVCGVNPYGEMDKKTLVKFYEKFGFKLFYDDCDDVVTRKPKK